MATKLQDNFTDANGASLDAHAMDVGAGWTENAGNFDIQGNEANTVVSGLNIATADAGAADCTIDVDIKHPDDADQTSGLVFRLSDTNNSWILVLFPSTTDQLQLYDKQAGSFTLRDSAAFAQSPGVFYSLQAVLSGNSITGTVDGGATVGFTSSFNATATRHGLRCNTVIAGVRWDNFLCTTAGATVLGAAALSGVAGLTPAAVLSAAGAASANASAALASSARRTAAAAAAHAGSASVVPAAVRVSAGLSALAASAALGVRLDAFAPPVGAVFLVPVETRRFIVAAENGTFAVPVEDRTFRVN